MKKILIILTILLLNLSIVMASETTVSDLLDNIVKNGGYTIVLGDDAPGTDSLAGVDITAGLQNYAGKKVLLEPKLVSEAEAMDKLILLGHPCKNLLIDLSCSEWPYKSGTALFKVDGNNLIIAGSTAEDTRNAAKIIAKYKDYSMLKKSSEVLSTGSGLEIPEVVAKPKQEIDKIVCGDGVCDEAEKESCAEDCPVEEILDAEDIAEPEENKDVQEAPSEKSDDEIIKPLDSDKTEDVSFFKKFWAWILNLFR